MVGVVERPLERDLRLTVLRSHPVSVFTLGSAVPVNKCAKGVVLPPDFMSSGATKPLPGGGWTPPERPVAEAVGSRILWWGVGIGAVVGLAWVASKRGMLANPSWESTTWEQAYREALREGLKPREAEEYAYEVLQAERDDRLNVLGGARDDYLSNPSILAPPRLIPDIIVDGRMPTKAEYEAANKLLREIAGSPGGKASAWMSTNFDDDEHRAWIAMSRAGLVRTIEAQPWNYVVLTEKGKEYLRQRSPSSNPRDVHGDVQVGDVFDSFGEVWTVVSVDRKKCEVGAETYYKDAFGKLKVSRRTKLHFRDLEAMKKLPESNPGRAKKQGFTRADADPEQLRLGIEHELEHTDSRKVAERIALDHLSETPDYYTQLDAMERGTFRGNPSPSRAAHYRAAADADRRASSLIDAARRARGEERERLLDEADAHLRKSVEHLREAGDTWATYEGSRGLEQISKLRARKANPRDAGPPYTHEEINTMTGHRSRKSTMYPTLEEALASARVKASRWRKFAGVEVLDRSGRLVETVMGVH